MIARLLGTSIFQTLGSFAYEQYLLQDYLYKFLNDALKKSSIPVVSSLNEIENFSVDGWPSEKIAMTDDGVVHEPPGGGKNITRTLDVVHGPFGGGKNITRTFQLPPHSSITLSLRYWSVNSWNARFGAVSIDGAVVWRKDGPGPDCCFAESGVEGRADAHPPIAFVGNQKCYWDVTVAEFAHSAPSLTLRIDSSLQQPMFDEAYAFNRFKLDALDFSIITPVLHYKVFPVALTVCSFLLSRLVTRVCVDLVRAQDALRSAGGRTTVSSQDLDPLLNTSLDTPRDTPILLSTYKCLTPVCEEDDYAAYAL